MGVGGGVADGEGEILNNGAVASVCVWGCVCVLQLDKMGVTEV